MANKTYQIKIESILGGIAPTSHFSSQDQFLACLGIDPSRPTDYFSRASGLLAPVHGRNVSNSNLNSVPMWITVPDPKISGNSFVYDVGGSVYTHSARTSPSGVVGLGDLNDGGSAHGNGAAYYDNYIYFARDTTIARYGPLDGTKSFTDDYWVATLGKTALSNTWSDIQYPDEGYGTYPIPGHYLHRHSDGKLYIADVVGNQGTIHYIQTSKTTAEGDTDAGSTYSKLSLGYGLWPMCMESYGSNLAIAVFEGQGNVNRRGQRGKIAFWDTTSQNISQITWVEFPDPVISAMKNINGVLYVFSGQTDTFGCRISKFIGGYTFEEVAYFEDGSWPFPGGVDGSSKRLMWGTNTSYPEKAGVVFSLGLQKSSLSNGIFGIMHATGGDCKVYSLALVDNFSLNEDYPSIGWSIGGSGTSNNGVDCVDGNFSLNYSLASQRWQSQIYKLGQSFKIEKIRIPMASGVTSSTIITPKIYTDDGNGTTYTLTTINSTNFPNKKNVVIRPEACTGASNFWLELNWSGTGFSAVGLPISIEYELFDD